MWPTTDKSSSDSDSDDEVLLGTPTKKDGEASVQIVVSPPSSSASNGGGTNGGMISNVRSTSTEVAFAFRTFTVSPDLSDEVFEDSPQKNLFQTVKIAVLVLLWFVCGSCLMFQSEKVEQLHQISIPQGEEKSYIINQAPTKDKIRVTLEGALLPHHYANMSINSMYVWLQIVSPFLDKNNKKHVQNVSEVWKVPLVFENLIGVVPEIFQKHEFSLRYPKRVNVSAALVVKIRTNMATNFPISVGYSLDPISQELGIMCAALILIGLYVLIIFELVHRTLAAMLASTISLAILSALNQRPTLAEIISWIDIETLLLLFSMMTLVTILSESGVFDYTAVLAYKITRGQKEQLINTLCLFTGILSSFLDNVTTVLLMTPITIRLCEVLKINPKRVLISMIIFSNIGGAVTPIGDPPNVIIASNSDVIEAGVTFGVFTMHMGIGVLLAAVVVHVHLRLMYMNTKDPAQESVDNEDLRRRILVWRRTAESLSSYSKDEEAVKMSVTKKTLKLVGKLRQSNLRQSAGDHLAFGRYEDTLKHLEQMYPIRDKPLLIKSGTTLVVVIFVFFLHSIPDFSRLGLGWTALLGAILLLLLLNRDNIESVFARIEWTTLLFFASLFILMEALAKMGLIDWIGRQTQAVIMSVEEGSRLAVAILIILWVSACASAFVDNIPLTTMMIRVATGLADDTELKLPLQPLVWALSFGACLGGNGTLFAASSNIVCAGVAEQHGYRFTFLEFMKIGFPVMISSMLVITIYLMVAHVVLNWN